MATTNEVEWLSRRFEELRKYEEEAVSKGHRVHENRATFVHASWMLSTLHAELVEQIENSLLYESDRIRNGSPMELENPLDLGEAGALARLAQRFVVGECLSDEFAPFYVAARAILDRLLERYETAAPVRRNSSRLARLHREIETLRLEMLTFDETKSSEMAKLRDARGRLAHLEAEHLEEVRRGLAEIEHRAETALVAGSLSMSPTCHLYRLRSLALEAESRGDRSLSATLNEFLSTLHERYGRYLRALAGLPTGALTEFPYLFSESVHQLETFYGGVTDAQYNDPNPPA
jgi:hypothetical protein